MNTEKKEAAITAQIAAQGSSKAMKERLKQYDTDSNEGRKDMTAFLADFGRGI